MNIDDPSAKKGPLMPASRAAPAPPAHEGNPWMMPVDGGRLRALRQARGLSRDVLASRAGISASTVARLEQQRGASCRGRTLVRLSAALDADPSAITPG